MISKVVMILISVAVAVVIIADINLSVANNKVVQEEPVSPPSSSPIGAVPNGNYLVDGNTGTLIDDLSIGLHTSHVGSATGSQLKCNVIYRTVVADSHATEISVEDSLRAAGMTSAADIIMTASAANDRKKIIAAGMGHDEFVKACQDLYPSVVQRIEQLAAERAEAGRDNQ